MFMLRQAQHERETANLLRPFALSLSKGERSIWWRTQAYTKTDHDK